MDLSAPSILKCFVLTFPKSQLLADGHGLDGPLDCPGMATCASTSAGSLLVI